MGRQDRDRGVGIGDTEERARDRVQETVRHERGHQNRSKEDRAEEREEEREERDQDACQGVDVDAWEEAGQGAEGDPGCRPREYLHHPCQGWGAIILKESIPDRRPAAWSEWTDANRDNEDPGEGSR